MVLALFLLIGLENGSLAEDSDGDGIDDQYDRYPDDPARWTSAMVRNMYDSTGSSFTSEYGPTNLSTSRSYNQNWSWGPVCVIDDKLYHAGYNSSIFCRYLENNSLIWSFDAGSGKLVSAPAFSPDMVYFGTNWGDGLFFAINRTSGKEVWNTHIGEVYTSSPILHDGIVVVGAINGKVTALDAYNGSILWTQNTYFTTHSSPSTDGENLFIAGTCYSLVNGSQKWTNRGIQSSTTFGMGMVFGTNGTHGIALDSDSGSLLWSSRIGLNEDMRSALDAGPCLANGMVYFASQSGTVACFTALNGSEVWRSETGMWITTPPVASGNGLIYIISTEIMVFDAFSGEVLDTAESYSMRSTPCLFNGSLYTSGSHWYVVWGDNQDRDSDGDGIGDDIDAFPLDQSQWKDSDGDWRGNKAGGNRPDGFPAKATQWSDTDGDGWGDNSWGADPDLFPRDPTQWKDRDLDGYGDNPDGDDPDVYIYDPSQWSDFDGDGFGDNASGNNPDKFPTDPTASADSDGDGYPDHWNRGQYGYNSTLGLELDEVKENPTQWKDRDNDGWGDNPNGLQADKFPDERSQWEDIDGDGYGDNLFGKDPDLFPNDPDEWSDGDLDGIGDNSDPDDDNDRMDDDWEIKHGLDPTDPTDGEDDPDGDGLSNLEEYLNGRDPNHFDRDPDDARRSTLVLFVVVVILLNILFIAYLRLRDL